MMRIFGIVVMSSAELDQILMQQEERFLELARQYVKVDMELMRRKLNDPRRPCSVIGNVFYTEDGIVG